MSLPPAGAKLTMAGHMSAPLPGTKRELIRDQTLCRELDRRGVAVHRGHLCAQPAIAAPGMSGVTRASLGCYSEAADVDALMTALSEIVRDRKRRP